MPLIIPANTLASGGFAVDNSVRLNGDAYVHKAVSAGNQRTFTYSFWTKRSTLNNYDTFIGYAGTAGGGGGTPRGELIFVGDGDDTLRVGFNPTASSWSNYTVSNRVFRDISAWYHIVLKVNTTSGTETERLKIFVNGVSQSLSGYPSQNFDTGFNVNGSVYHIGRSASGTGNFIKGYLAEAVFIDGTALDADSFGEFDEDSGIWKPIDVSELTFGTNGFYLDFENSGSLGDDVSGNGNDFTVNNLTAIDQTTDTPTNNFATWNPLFRKGTTTPAFAEGNLQSTFDDGGANEFALTTFGASSGKWYTEVKWISATGTGATATGILDMAYTGTADPNNAVTNAFGYFGSGQKNVSGTASSYGASYTSGDIISIALNCDDNQVTFYKNGASQGVISIIAGVTYGIFTSDYGSKVCQLNTGNPPFAISSGNTDGNDRGNFEYAPPSGYLSLCTANLSEVLG